MTFQFDVGEALACAEASSAAYDSHSGGSPLAHFLIQEFPTLRVAAFEGTKNPLDWLTDGKIKFVEYPKGSGLYVHSGFNESMLSVREDLLSQLASLPAKRTFISGHSKGGAEARQFVRSLTAELKSEIGFCGSHTFGEPRSMSVAAALDYDAQYRDCTIRWVYQEDFVARVPFLCGRYRHAGQEALLPSFGNSYILNPSIRTLLASDIYGLGKSFLARRSVTACNALVVDHFIANYLGAMRAIQPVMQTSVFSVN